jgi:hypothetical protein
MEGKCSENITLDTSNIRGYIQDVNCQLTKLDCDVNFKIMNFELESSGSLSIEINDKDSYCSAIKVKVQTSSSIPDEDSSLISYVAADKDYFFKGYIPTDIHLMMIPSLFSSDTDKMTSEATGYHISKVENDVKGSQMSYKE